VAVTGTTTTKMATRNPTTAVLVSSQSPMEVRLALLLAMTVAATVAIMAAALVDSSLNVFVRLFKPIL
jgi:hypothetical protein